MGEYLQIFLDGYRGYAGYLWYEVTHPHWRNYFYWLIGVSAFFFLLELLTPWRKDQPKFRKDFWLDFFYMFFNFFLFSLIIYNAASDLVVNLFRDLLALFGIRNLVALEIASWPAFMRPTYSDRPTSPSPAVEWKRTSGSSPSCWLWSS